MANEFRDRRIGSGAEDTVAGNDSRLTDARVKLTRTQALADASTVTFDTGNYEEGNMGALSQAVAVQPPTLGLGGTTQGREYIWNVISAAQQNITFDASAFTGGTDLALPTQTSGSGKLDLFKFKYHNTLAKWVLVGQIRGTG